MILGRSSTYIPASLALVLSLLFFLLPCRALAEQYVWPAWRAVTADGSEFHSRQLDGKVVVMTMWASWCPTSRKQLPVLDKLQEFYPKDSVQVLSFSFDRSQASHQKFVRESRLKLPSIYARNGEGLRVVKMLQEGAGTLEAVPTVLIYDRRGRLAHRLVGYLNRKQLEDFIAPLLKE